MLERLSVIRLIGCFKASRATSNLIGIKPYGMPGGGVDDNSRLEALTIHPSVSRFLLSSNAPFPPCSPGSLTACGFRSRYSRPRSFLRENYSGVSAHSLNVSPCELYNIAPPRTGEVGKEKGSPYVLVGRWGLSQLAQLVDGKKSTFGFGFLEPRDVQ